MDIEAGGKEYRSQAYPGILSEVLQALALMCRHFRGGRVFHAIIKNVNGIAITPVAIRIGSIIAGSNDLPMATKYGNG